MEADEVEAGKPMFELHAPDGQRWALYADGRSEGFPEGTILINRALPLLSALCGKQQIPSLVRAD